MQKKHLGITAGILILIILGGIFHQKGPSFISGGEGADPSSQSSTNGMDGEGHEDGVDISGLDKGQAAMPKGTSLLEAPAPQVPWAPEIKAKLRSFQNLQNKSVMTPQEEEERLQ